MTLPNSWVIFLASSLLGSMTLAQPHMTGREARTRHLVVPTVAEASVLELHVAPGHQTSVTFERPLTPEAVTVEDGRERLKRLDVTETHVTVEPAAELEPGSRLRLTVRFSDGRLPETVVLALMSSPSEVDSKVTVSRLPSTMGEALAELNATRARLAEAHQQLQAQRPDCAVESLTERMFSALGQGEDVSIRDVFEPPIENLGVEEMQASVHRSSRLFILGIRFRVSASARSLVPWTPDDVHLVHRATGRVVKVRSLEMRPPRFSVGEEVAVVLELEPLPSRSGNFVLQCGNPEREPFIQWRMVSL